MLNMYKTIRDFLLPGYTTLENLDAIYATIEAIPKAELREKDLYEFYEAVKNLPKHQPIFCHHHKIVTLAKHVDVSVDVFFYAFCKLFDRVSGEYPNIIAREIIHDLCYTHQVQKMQMVRNWMNITVMLSNIFIHGDSEALDIAINFSRKSEHSSWIGVERSYEELLEVFQKHFLNPLSMDPEIKKKRQLILENNNLLPNRERVILFHVLLSTGYSCEGCIKDSSDLATLLEYISHHYERDAVDGYIPKHDPQSFMTYLLDNFPHLEDGLDKVDLLKDAWNSQNITMHNFLTERYPEISFERTAERGYDGKLSTLDGYGFKIVINYPFTMKVHHYEYREI